MASKKLFCSCCKAKKLHDFVQEVKFTTKIREITNRTYQCSECKTIKVTKYEKYRKDYRILDS